MLHRYLAVWSSLLVVLALSGAVHAAPVTYDFVNGTLNGTTVTGTLTLDDQTQTILSWNISTEAGPDDNGTANFDGATFSDSTGVINTSTPAQIILRENLPNPFQSPGINDNLDIRFDTGVVNILGFGPAGGSVGITECWNCSPARSGTVFLVPQQPPAASVQFAATNLDVGEGAGTTAIILQRSGSSAGVVSVEVLEGSPGTAIAGDDFVDFSGVLVTWADGDTADKVVDVTLIDDDLVEGTENFELTLSNVQGGVIGQNAILNVNILDNDGATINPTIEAASFCAGAGGFEFDVLLSGTTTTEFIFRISGDDGAFLAPTERFQVNFDANGNVTSSTPPEVVTIGSVQNDRWVDGLVNNAVISPSGADTYRVTGVIANGTTPFTDSDLVGQVGFRTSEGTMAMSNLAIDACPGQANAGALDFDAATATVDENVANGALQFTVTRTGGNSGVVDVTVTASAGTATEGSDFQTVNTLVSFADGDDAPQTVTLNNIIIDDTDAEQDETFTLTLSNPTNNATLGNLTSQTITIIDDDGTGPDAGGDEQVDGPVGGQVEITFPVDGVFPININTNAGAVNPTVLNQAGDVTFTLDVDPQATPGDTINAVITLTDANDDITTKQVSIDVVAPQAQRNLAELAGLTRNQQQVATALDSLCGNIQNAGSTDADTLDLADKCVTLRDTGTTDAQAINALDAINPEELAVLATSALRLSTLQHGNLDQRINGLRSGATGIDLAGLDIEIKGQRVPGEAIAEIFNNLTGGAAGSDDFGRWGLFLDGKIKWGDKDATENEQAFDFDVAFLTVGADYRFRDNLIAGGALSWGKIEADFDSGGEFDIDSLNASLFATWFAESFYVDVLFTYGENDYDTERRIQYTDIGGLVDLNAIGSTEGEQISGGIAAGYDFNHGALTIGPHIGAYTVDLDVDDFVERGGAGLNMAIGEQGAESFTLNAGFHASYVFTPSWGVLIPHLRADAVFELEDDAQSVTVGFAADPFRNDPLAATPTIQIETDTPDEQYMVINAGVSAQFIRGISAFVNYQYTSSMEDWAIEDLTWGLRWERSF